MFKRMIKSGISRRSVHHIMNTYFLSTIILIFGVQQVLSQWDVYLTCPVDWYVGEPVNLICEVSKNSLATKCGNTPQAAAFYINTGSGDEEKSIVNSTTISNCQLDSSGSGCQSNSTFYIFYFKFLAEKNANSNWSCQVACVKPTGGPPANFIPQSATNCINVQVKTKGETTPGGTSTGGTSTDGTTTGNGGLSEGGKIGLGVGLGVGIPAIIVTVVVIIKLKCKQSDANSGSHRAVQSKADRTSSVMLEK